MKGYKSGVGCGSGSLVDKGNKAGGAEYRTLGYSMTSPQTKTGESE